MSIFSHVKVKKPSSNIFDLSHDRKFSCKFGELTPCFLMDCIPGDNIRLNTSQLLRFAPLIAPVMHQVNVYVHYFFVPNRLLWDNWEDFITGGEDGEDTSVFPFFGLSGPFIDPGTLADYLGVPDTGSNNINISPLPFSAYTFVYNEYYRDQNLISEQSYKLSDGDNAALVGTITQIRKRAWQHDYFTSALPWTQKGPEATLPLGDTAPLIGVWSDPGTKVRNSAGSLIGTVDLGTNTGLVTDTGGAVNHRVDVTDHTYADLSSATAASINDLRQAFKLQEWLEKNARGGSRYTESIMVHFGVRPQDARLQRPEFLGGGSTPVSISEVLQTSSTATEPTPQGNMAGHGVSAGGNAGFSYTCQEHGYIIGIMSVMPKSAYQQGIPKHFLKNDKFDFYFPTFAHLGEQPILSKELYVVGGGDPDDELTFGYTPRYAEYKFINSSVHGEFKTTLDFWHMGRIFSSRPLLNQTFIQMSDAEVERVFAVTDSERLYVHMYHRIKARRSMPYFGTPLL